MNNESKNYKMFNRLICIKNNDNWFLDSQMPSVFPLHFHIFWILHFHIFWILHFHIFWILHFLIFWIILLLDFTFSHLLDFWTFVFFIFPFWVNSFEINNNFMTPFPFPLLKRIFFSSLQHLEHKAVLQIHLDIY